MTTRPAGFSAAIIQAHNLLAEAHPFEEDFPEFAQGKLMDTERARLYFQFLGKEVRIYHGCRVVPSQKVSIGDFSQIDEGVRIYAGQGVVIGRHVHLATLSSISGGGECHIHDFAGIGVGCRLITGTEQPMKGGLTNPTVPPELRSVQRSRIVVEKHALVFTNSILLPGVTIGEGAVVSAGSLVHKSLQPWTLYAGTPLVAIGRRDRESVIAAEMKLNCP